MTRKEFIKSVLAATAIAALPVGLANEPEYDVLKAAIKQAKSFKISQASFAVNGGAEVLKQFCKDEFNFNTIEIGYEDDDFVNNFLTVRLS